MIPLQERKLQLQKKLKLKQVALELMMLSGAIRRADIEVHHRPFRVMREISSKTPRHSTNSKQSRVRVMTSINPNAA
jgi:hypothetical protein